MAAAAIPASANPRAKRAKSAAPAPSPIPTPSALTLRWTSAAASCTSRRASELACSATCLTAAPSPPFGCPSVSRMGMSSPVDELGHEDARDQGGAGDDERVRPTTLLLVLRRRRRGRRHGLGPDAAVRRMLSTDPRLDQARLQLAQEDRVVGQVGSEFGDEAALRASAL